MRVESATRTRNGGYVHRLGDAPPWDGRRVARVTLRTDATTDFGQLAAEYAARATDSMVDDFARGLGVSTDSLRRLSVGWTGRAWAIPMRRTVDGPVVGIRLRCTDGRKLSVKGGREGLFIPDDLPGNRRLIVCEGPTDCAALLSLDFAAIGRPSCSGAVKLLIDFCRGRDVCIFEDADEPGRIGARTLALALHLVAKSVRVCSPPKLHKDCRGWVQSGATKENVLTVIRETVPCGVVRFRTV